MSLPSHPPGERPFKCAQCDKAFNQKSALQVHTVKHTGNKPFKCDVCSIRFTQKSNMKHHMKRAHGYGEHQIPHHTPPALFVLGLLQRHRWSRLQRRARVWGRRAALAGPGRP
jgi:uncharacterized C2H2 Zn-finger protein